MPRKILFIVNPKAGKGISDQIIEAIRKNLPASLKYLIIIWKDKNHFEEIAELLKSEQYTDAVAVGGDGTVNEVAKTILQSKITLGIIPIGSGNGLARSLGLSMNIQRAIKQIVEAKTEFIDSGDINGRAFFCTSGIGFDAHIGNLFATSVKRGLNSYIKITISQLFRYKAKNYTLNFNGKSMNRKAFLITVANAGQYGNDFYIAPQANMQDGLFHVVVLKPFNIFKLPGLFIKMLKKKAHLAMSIETFVTNHLIVYRDEQDSIHFDGEPAMEGKRLEYKNAKASLRVIVGDNFQLQKITKK